MPELNETVIVLAAAFLLDAVLGDPVYPLHPVRLMGHLAKRLETICFRMGNGYLSGGIFWCLMIFLTVSTYGAARYGLALISPWPVRLFDIYLLYSCFALTDLVRHARPIRRALENDDIETARERLSWIVGRETKSLDVHAVSRAAVESVAESFVDGLFSPLFWFTVVAVIAASFGQDGAFAGVAAAVGYRTVNTLDSMVGYKNDRYRKFGYFSAKTDDLFNYLPARLAVLLLFASAALNRLSPIVGYKAWRRDRRKTPSPNAGQTESFAAGALDLRLGGPITYPFGIMEKPWLGFGSFYATARHIDECSRLVIVAGWLALVVFLIAGMGM